MWRKIIYTGLLLASVSSCVFVGGCEQEKEIVQPKRGPLQPPFSEVIPSAEDIFFEPYSHTEETICHPDGTITYLRIYGNESASWHSLSGDEKPESPAVVLDLLSTCSALCHSFLHALAARWVSRQDLAITGPRRVDFTS